MRQMITFSPVRLQHLRQLAVVLIGVLVAALLLSACTGSDDETAGESENSTGVPKVVTTLYPLEYFTGRIGGNSVEVENLMSPGVEAHDFEPTPGDIRKLDTADIIIYNGAGLEPWMDRALSSIGGGDRIIVEASQGLADIAGGPHDEDEHEEERDEDLLNPHVWLDPLNAVEMVKLVRDGLSQVNPEEADAYSSNAEAVIAELQQLHQRWQEGLASCRFHQFITNHEAFNYLARRYGLEQVAISGVSPEAEPSPGELARLTDRIEELGVRYIMSEPIVYSGLAKTLAKEVGAELLTLHPLATLTRDELDRGETYMSVMEANLANLHTALECSE